MCEVARRCGAEVVRVEAPWGRAIDPQQLLDARAAHPERARARGRARGDVHRCRERRRAACRALRDTDTLLLVDMVTSLGGIPVEVDAWGIDAVYSGTQKCLGVPPGLSPVSFSDRAVERVRSRANPPQSWYLDLGLIADYVGSRASLPPHRADLDALRVARRARRAARRGTRGVMGAARAGRRAAAGRAARARASVCSPKSAASRNSRRCGSPKASTTRKVRGELLRPLRHRSRRRSRRPRRQGVAHRPHGPRRESTRSPRSWAPSPSNCVTAPASCGRAHAGSALGFRREAEQVVAVEAQLFDRLADVVEGAVVLGLARSLRGRAPGSSAGTAP